MVLPLFNVDKYFIGSATFLENGFLVTAAHCFFTKDPTPTRFTGNFCIGYQDKLVPLPKPLYENFVPKEETHKSCHEYSDISIFRAPEFLMESKNSFSLNWPDSEVFNAPVEIIGYCYDSDKPNKTSGQIINAQMASTNIENYDSNMRTFCNCFRVTSFISDGSSGGAIIHDGYCIGIIVFGTPLRIKPPGETVALKASYLKPLLNLFASC